MQKYSRGWIFAGLLVLEALILLPTHLLLDETGGVHFLDTPQSLFIYSLPAFGLFIAAFLLYTGLARYNEWRNTDSAGGWTSHIMRRQAGWSAVAALVLCVLLLAKAMHELYWLLVWDKTADGIGYLWMVLAPLPVGFVCGLMLLVALEGRQRLAGLLYLLLVPGLLIGMSILAPQADLQQITERRAGQVVHAIEAFRARYGFYPPELRYLISWSTPLLPKPVIIYGQDWCYEGRDDHYTLGYVYHGHWSDPHLVGQVYKTVGADPDPGGVCNTEIEVLRLQRYVPYIP
jgi:hypothetical protein